MPLSREAATVAAVASGWMHFRAFARCLRRVRNGEEEVGTSLTWRGWREDRPAGANKVS